jgi:CheY-like chemotaxis protein
VQAEDGQALMEAAEIRGGRVLVVDDDPEVREAVETALELEGHSVTTATDGLAALKRLGQAEFDAVVLDVLMPNLDGFEVCRRLRALGNRTPVLFMTARDSEEDTIRGLDLGADDYLVKPFGLGELLARVRALLRRTRPVGDDAPLWFAGLSLDPQTREANAFRFADCMRSRGAPNFPDPTTRGQVTPQMLANAGINLQQPAVLQAGDACVGVTHGVITRAAVAQFVAVSASLGG